MLRVLCCHYQHFLSSLSGHFLFLEMYISIQHDLIMVCAVLSVSWQNPALNGLKISAESMMLMPGCISVNIKVMQLSMYYSGVIFS